LIVQRQVAELLFCESAWPQFVRHIAAGALTAAVSHAVRRLKSFDIAAFGAHGRFANGIVVVSDYVLINILNNKI